MRWRGWRQLWRSRRHARRQRAEQLYQALVKQARTPALYSELGVPDTPEGRFEMIALHVSLVLRRLRPEGALGRAVGQELFDVMFADMDSSLRELGVSDLSVGKYVKRLVGNLYARLAALDRGLGEPGRAAPGLPDAAALQPMLRTNVYCGGAPPRDAQVTGLVDYLIAQDRALIDQGVAALCEGTIAWVDPILPVET
jgi:cytochrome b pre-mRNA-processing protein 3